MLSKLPLVSINNYTLVNFFAKARVIPASSQDGFMAVDYNMTPGMRPDQLSSLYYGAPIADWAIYLANPHIVNPHRDLPADEASLNRYLARQDKNKILFWRVNWRSKTEERLTVSQFETLHWKLKHYWKPVTDEEENIVFYVRLDEDRFVDTNVCGDVVISGTVPEWFKAGKTWNNKITLATDPVPVNETQHLLSIKHLIQTIEVSESWEGMTIDSITITHTAIDNIELSYWEPVTLETHVRELNEHRRKIRLFIPEQLEQLEEEIERLLLGK